MSNLVQPVSDIYNDKPTKPVLYLSGNSDVDADDLGEEAHDDLGPHLDTDHHGHDIQAILQSDVRTSRPKTLPPEGWAPKPELS